MGLDRYTLLLAAPKLNLYLILHYGSHVFFNDLLLRRTGLTFQYLRQQIASLDKPFFSFMASALVFGHLMVIVPFQKGCIQGNMIVASTSKM